eukprot:958718-Rhodomonas_salina.2
MHMYLPSYLPHPTRYQPTTPRYLHTPSTVRYVSTAHRVAPYAMPYACLAYALLYPLPNSAKVICYQQYGPRVG